MRQGKRENRINYERGKYEGQQEANWGRKRMCRMKEAGIRIEENEGWFRLTFT